MLVSWHLLFTLLTCLLVQITSSPESPTGLQCHLQWTDEATRALVAA